MSDKLPVPDKPPVPDKSPVSDSLAMSDSLPLPDTLQKSSVWEDYQRQQVLNTILAIALQPVDLNAQLQLMLATLTAIPLYRGRAKGCLYIYRDKQDPIIVQVGGRTGCSDQCTFYGRGQCICLTRIADMYDLASKQADFSQLPMYSLDADGNSLLGHLLMPINHHTATWYGVLHLVIDEHYILSESDKNFLHSFTNAIVGLIERKWAKEELLRSRQRLTIAMDAAQLSLWSWDVKEGQLDYDDRWFEWLGYERKSFEQNLPHWKMLIHPDDWEHSNTIFSAHLRGEIPAIKVEVRFLGNDKCWHWFLCSGQCVKRDESGEPLIVSGIFFDIEEKKQQELQLHQAYQYKTEFLTNLSHELRTPLNAITGFAGALKKGIDGPLNERQHESLEHILHSSQRLLFIMEDILDLSMFETQSIVLHKTKLDLRTCIQDVIERFVQSAEKNQSKIHRHFPEISGCLQADERLLRKAIEQLLSNALKFTQNGHVDIGFEVLDNLRKLPKEAQKLPVDSAACYALIKVKDTGVGMSSEHLEQIFHSFHQLDHGSAKQYPGLGVGLSLVKNIAQAHGGTVWVRSQRNSGSEFSMLIPADLV